MRLTNFRISENNIELEFEGKSFDLHNCFDFVGFDYKTPEDVIELRWKKGTEEFVPKVIPARLNLIFEGVDLFKVRQRDPESLSKDGNCLRNMGFINNELIDEMSGFTANNPDKKCTDLLIEFENGLSIKISAESATLDVVPVQE